MNSLICISSIIHFYKQPMIFHMTDSVHIRPANNMPSGHSVSKHQNQSRLFFLFLQRHRGQGIKHILRALSEQETTSQQSSFSIFMVSHPRYFLLQLLSVKRHSCLRAEVLAGNGQTPADTATNRWDCYTTVCIKGSTLKGKM